MFLKVLIFLYPLVAIWACPVINNPDPCDKIKPIQNFNAKKIQGVWYTHAVACSTTYKGDCTKFNITGVNGVVQISDRQQGKYRHLSRTFTQEGNTSKFEVPAGYGKLPTGVLWVVADYDNFTIHFHCFNEGIGWIEIATRSRKQDAKILENAKEELKKNGLTIDTIHPITQHNCTN